MIDHVSIAVKDLAFADKFYTSILSKIGYFRMIQKPGTVGFGKKYPDFWLNCRPDITVSGSDNGFHVCLRAGSKAQVEDFYNEAMLLGAKCDGEPGLRVMYSNNYYAAFIIDMDGNKIEVVTFVDL